VIIYGVALLSVCLVAGMLIGETLGILLGVDANVGGVGIAMLFLVFASNSAKFKSLSSGAAGDGISFWSAMYLPIVVALAARQNVAGAIEGGLLALTAGVAAVLVSFALVPVLSRVGSGSRSATLPLAFGTNIYHMTPETHLKPPLKCWHSTWVFYCI